MCKERDLNLESDQSEFLGHFPAILTRMAGQDSTEHFMCIWVKMTNEKLVFSYFLPLSHYSLDLKSEEGLNKSSLTSQML